MCVLQIVANRIMATRMKSLPLRSKSVPCWKPSGVVALISTTTPSSWESSFKWANGSQWPVLPNGWRAALTSSHIIFGGKASRTSRSFFNPSTRTL